MDISHFVHYLPVVGLFSVNLDCFQCLAIMNNASTYMHMHLFVWTYFFLSLG